MVFILKNSLLHLVGLSLPLYCGGAAEEESEEEEKHR
jgi:hypothetical protein